MFQIDYLERGTKDVPDKWAFGECPKGKKWTPEQENIHIQKPK